MPSLRVCVLGPVTIIGPDPIDLVGTNARALVASLALDAPAARSADAVADDVWGDDLPQNPRAALQTLVSRVRAAAGADIVRSTPGGYALGDADTDLSVARALLDAADRTAHHATTHHSTAHDGAAHHDAAHHVPGPVADDGPGDDDPAARVALLDEALALWRGEPGVDLDPRPVGQAVRDAAAAVRARLEASRAHALAAAGRLADAARALADLAAARPFDEAVHAELMSALAAAGRTGEALAVFAALRTRLREQLGTSPGAQVTELNARLLRTGAGRGRVRIGLQAAPNALLGRDADLAAVTDLLTHARVVTILGTGGLGKTRLAQALAAAADDPAVAVVPLAGVRADDDVPAAIAAALGVSEASPGGRLADVRARPDLRARVVGLLAEQPTLLVLDNCEQVVDGVASWVADMLGAVPSLHVLTTSRTPLSLAAEAVYPLAPLELGEGTDATAPAVQLFVERAHAVRPGASLPRDEVARLCAHLDGLPLAIELAAARVRTMTTRQIEERLTDRFALLTTGDRAAPARHRTLEAVIGWSWDLLDEPARRAMATLSVLPDGFAADVAAAVLEEPVDDVLDRLVSQSLLLVVEQPGGQVRFRMLETIREFALARLGDQDAQGRSDPIGDGVDARPGDEPAEHPGTAEHRGDGSAGADAAWRRVTHWARDFATAWLGSAFHRDVHARVRVEHDNLIAVLHHAIDREDDATTVLLFALLGQTWMVQGAFTEMTAFAPAAFAALPRVEDDEVPAEALVTTLIFAIFMTQAEAGVSSGRLIARVRMLRRRNRQMDPLFAAVADGLLAVVVAGMGHDRAEVGRALHELCTSPDRSRRLVGDTLLSQWAENEGQPQVALDAGRRVWQAAHGTESEWFATMSAASIAQLASQTAQPALALEWLDRADEGYRLFGAEEQQRQQAWLRASNLLALGDVESARRIFDDLAVATELTEDGLEAASIGLYGLAEIARGQGRKDAAATLFARSLSRFGTAFQRGSPWYLMALAGMLSAAVFDDLFSAVWRADKARRLRTRAIAVTRLRPDMADHPVLGTVLMGWSAWAVGETGLREQGLAALALGQRLAARQDLLSLHWQTHRDHAAGLIGADAVAAAEAEASALPHDGLIERAVRLLRAVGH
ncbi:AfsR/SARP family transcriptional regulator [Microbacterium luticocti]|uniref:AfsR/SARP family transcriptional regulator n=1 Tax=Microbacterium luticocti TaxID=451764 RepID=UPI00042A1338|nr:BTAD domain-containing putative transcriptional regulator [Microbacterium luticocti]